MSEREPSLDELVAAIKLKFESLDQEPDTEEMPGKEGFLLSRDAMEMIPDRPKHLLNDMMTQWKELEQRWKLAATPEKKLEIRNRIKNGLRMTLDALEKRPKT